MSLQPGSGSSSLENQTRKKQKESLFLHPQPPRLAVVLRDIPLVVQKIWSSNRAAQLEATTYINELLSIASNIWIDDVMNSGVVPRIVTFLGWHVPSQLQLQAACVVTNITSGKSEQTKLIIEYGAIPLLVHQLHHSIVVDVKTQALWALSNIAADSPATRDLVLNQGVLFPLTLLDQQHSKLSLLRIVAWTIANLCGGNPRPDFILVEPALLVLRWLIQLSDENVLAEASRALALLSYNGKTLNVKPILEHRTCQRLVQLLQHPSPTVVLRSLQVVGNIVSGDDTQTQLVIDLGVLPSLRQLLVQNENKRIKKYACWTISNIAVGNKTQMQAVTKAGIISPLVKLLENAEIDIKKEAAWAIHNATYYQGYHEQIRFLVQQGCIKPICDFLTNSDPMTMIVCLKSLHNILEVGEDDKKMGLNGGINSYAQMIDQCEGLSKIENLQNHHNNEISQIAVKLVKSFWDKDEPRPV